MTGNCLGRFAEFKPEMLGTSKVVVRGFPLDGECLPRTMMCYVFGECHAPSTLKIIFIDYKKVHLPLQKTELFVPNKI
jgi:hypothetical protein